MQARHSPIVTGCLPMAKALTVTRCEGCSVGSSLLPIIKDPAGTLTISGQRWQSRKVPPARFVSGLTGGGSAATRGPAGGTAGCSELGPDSAVSGGGGAGTGGKPGSVSGPAATGDGGDGADIGARSGTVAAIAGSVPFVPVVAAALGGALPCVFIRSASQRPPPKAKR